MDDVEARANDLVRLGIEIQQRGDLETALQSYDQAVALAPDFLLARLRRAHVQLQRKLIAAALTDLDYVLERDPKDARAYCYRGMAWQAQDDDERAVADFGKALEQGESASVLLCRAWSLRRMGRTDEAILDFKRAEELRTADGTLADAD